MGGLVFIGIILPLSAILFVLWMMTKKKGFGYALFSFWGVLIVLYSIGAISLYLNPGSEFPESPPVVEKRLEAKIQEILDSHPFNGVILLTKATDTLFFKAVGFSDVTSKIKLKTSDQFVVGSISKQMTAALILLELEQGNIALDDPLDRYVQVTTQEWGNRITIHQLLTHTHGIRTLDAPLEFEPGTKFEYSQLGYELLAQILEKINDRSFEAIAMRLFQKLGLNSTVHPDTKTYTELVKGYVENENGDMEYAPNSLENYVPAGGFISTAEDLNKWNELLHSRQILNRTTLELMHTKYAVRNHPIFDEVNYGYGLLFLEGEEQVQIGALGYAPGFVSASYYYPATKHNLVVLENTARDLDDFKTTFKVHTELMHLVKEHSR